MPRHPQPPSDVVPAPAFGVHRFAVGDGVCVLILRGELDLPAASALALALDDLHEDGYRRFVLDLSPLPFIDSTGLGVLIAFQQTVGQRLALAEPQAFVSDLIEIAGLADTFDVFSRLDDALAHVGILGVV